MRRLVWFVSSLTLAWGSDPYCPAYPRQQYTAYLANLTTEREAAKFSQQQRQATQQHRLPAAGSANFIDDFIFSKMAADGVPPAPMSSDTEFLRRMMLDLTGRIPAPDKVLEFSASTNASKRTVLIDSLLASPAYVDYWTLYFGNRFQVTSAYYQLVGIPGRNLFNAYLREFIANDRPFNQVATELITATGDSHRVAPPNFLMRGIQQGDPIQDTWDTLTNLVTTQFLGVQTQCVSCHDGRRHLEEINLYLWQNRREDFMRLSAFFSRMNIQEAQVDAFNQQRHAIITDRSTGVYHGKVDPQNPGPRPPRVGTYEPTYLFTGQQPSSEEWRADLARLITGDRQFARAAVNYIWAHFFQTGIVNPPEAWDLARINAKAPPPAPWTLQPSHPELLEALADFFIANGYRIKPLIHLIAESNAYQLASRYEGTWRPEYARYFAKYAPRRLSAEELYDAIATATQTETPMYVEGFDQPLLYAVQLPDPTEPRYTPMVQTFLRQFGRGDWWQIPRTSEGSVVQVLFHMNDSSIVNRVFSNLPTRVSRLLASTMSDQDAITQLFLATLGRPPTATEMEVARRNQSPSTTSIPSRRESWFSDIQWALINRAEFLFNH